MGSTPHANLLFTSAPTCSPPGVLETVPTVVVSVIYTVAPMLQTCETHPFDVAHADNTAQQHTND